jgi:hypothetical protein
VLELTAATSSPDRQAQARYLLQCVWTMAQVGAPAAGLALGRLDETVVEAVTVHARRRASEPGTLPPDVAAAAGELGANEQFSVANDLLRTSSCSSRG